MRISRLTHILKLISSVLCVAWKELMARGQHDGDQSNNYATYVLLRPNVSVKQFEAKIGVALDNYYSPDPDGRKAFSGFIDITPGAKDLHLYYTMDSETRAKQELFVGVCFAALATLILAMACFNFINLSTARLSQRAKEVGLKR